MFPLGAGLGTVKITVIDSNGAEVDSSKLDEVKRYVDDKKPIGATVSVCNAEKTLININVRIKRHSNTPLEILKENLKQKLSSYINLANLNDDNIKFAKISNILLKMEGIVDFDNLTLNGNSNTVEIENDHIAKLGEVIIVER